MGGKTDRILDSIQRHAGEAVYREIVAQCGEAEEKPTPAKQARYAQSIMESLSERCDTATIANVMEVCGRACFSGKAMKLAKKAYAESADLPDFLNRLNQQHIGGGKLQIEGDVVIGVYDHCYCGLASKAKNLSQDYCYCSVGWFKELFSSAMGRDIDVQKRETILGGADACVFEIHAI